MGAHVMLLLTVMDTIAAPDQYHPQYQHFHHQHFHHHHVSIALMVPMVRIAALVILILVVPLNGLPVETVVFHHHQEKNAMKSVISLAVVVAVERVVKEERVEREDTTVVLVDTDVSYSFMVMMMADLVDLVDLMIMNSMADTTADSEADSVVTAERVDTEEKVEREEKEERVDTTVDTKFVKSSVKLCT